MNIDPSVIAALEAAIEADPENSALRLHLASLEIQRGEAARALSQVQAILAVAPTHLEALSLAARAATACHRKEAAAGYRQLLAALAPELADATPDAAAGPRDQEPKPASAPAATKLSPAPGEEAKAPAEPTASEASGAEDDGEDDSAPRGKVVPLKVVRGGGGSAAGLAETETPEVTLADVAGLEQVKRRLNLAFLAPLKNPQLMEMYGKSLRGGLMLYGPPGCGKTFLARATAGELGASFISVGLSDVLDMWLGESEKRMHELFNQARRQAPCVLFIDEIDALGRKRSLMRHSAGMSGVVNQLLAELDGVDARNEGLFVLAATNHPWDVDTALRRPGRLDRTLLVLPPDGAARKGILEKNMADRPTEKLDLDWLAGRTQDYSGADLVHLCDASAELAMEASLTSGKPRPIRQRDFKGALKDVRASTRPWFEVARNYALFNNEGGAYDDLVAYLRQRKMV